MTEINGGPWFVARDVTEACGHSGAASKHTQYIEVDEKKVAYRSDILFGRLFMKEKRIARSTR